LAREVFAILSDSPALFGSTEKRIEHKTSPFEGGKRFVRTEGDELFII